MNFVGEFKKIEPVVNEHTEPTVGSSEPRESTTDKLLREITDLRLIYNEVLNELDVLKSVINDFDEIKKELNILKGSVESNSKSLLEIMNPKEKPVCPNGLSLERPCGLKKKGTGLVVGQGRIKSPIIKRK